MKHVFRGKTQKLKNTCPLRFPNCSIRVTITGKRVNRGVGVGLGLEIPVHYIFYGDERVIDWVEKEIEKVNDNIATRVNKCFN